MHPIVFEIIIFASLALLIVSQVIFPALLNKPLFPSIRARKALSQLDEARAEAFVKEIEEEAHGLRRRSAAYTQEDQE